MKKLNELMIENQEFLDKELEDLLDLRNEILEITEEFEKLYTTYDVIDEGLIKRLNLQKLFQRSKKAAIRMKRLMANPAHKQKIARSKKRMKSTAQLLVKAQKQARNKIRSKFFPKYNEMGIAAKAKVDQMITVKHGAKIAKMAKRLLPKVKVQARQDVKRARELATSDPDA